MFNNFFILVGESLNQNGQQSLMISKNFWIQEVCEVRDSENGDRSVHGVGRFQAILEHLDDFSEIISYLVSTALDDSAQNQITHILGFF